MRWKVNEGIRAPAEGTFGSKYSNSPLRHSKETAEYLKNMKMNLGILNEAYSDKTNALLIIYAARLVGRERPFKYNIDGYSFWILNEALSEPAGATASRQLNFLKKCLATYGWNNIPFLQSTEHSTDRVTMDSKIIFSEMKSQGLSITIKLMHTCHGGELCHSHSREELV